MHPPTTYSRSDDDLAAAVRRALDSDPLVPSRYIHVRVRARILTLGGEVAFLTQRADAERAARTVGGLREIDNRITIAPSRALLDDVRDAIETALRRRALREARHIAAEVHQGRVILSGPVRSEEDRAAVVGAARTTHGVVEVEDRLQPMQPADQRAAEASPVGRAHPSP